MDRTAGVEIVRLNIKLTRDEWRRLRTICAQKDSTIQAIVSALIKKIL